PLPNGFWPDSCPPTTVTKRICRSFVHFTNNSNRLPIGSCHRHQTVVTVASWAELNLNITFCAPELARTVNLGMLEEQRLPERHAILPSRSPFRTRPPTKLCRDDRWSRACQPFDSIIRGYASC